MNGSASFNPVSLTTATITALFSGVAPLQIVGPSLGRTLVQQPYCLALAASRGLPSRQAWVGNGVTKSENGRWQHQYTMKCWAKWERAPCWNDITEEQRGQGRCTTQIVKRAQRAVRAPWPAVKGKASNPTLDHGPSLCGTTYTLPRSTSMSLGPACRARELVHCGVGQRTQRAAG